MDSHSSKNDELPPPTYANIIQNSSTLPTQQPLSSHVNSHANNAQVLNNSNKDINPMSIPQVPTITPAILQQPGQAMWPPRPISQQPASGITGPSHDNRSCISPPLLWMPKPFSDII